MIVAIGLHVINLWPLVRMGGRLVEEDFGGDKLKGQVRGGLLFLARLVLNTLGVNRGEVMVKLALKGLLILSPIRAMAGGGYLKFDAATGCAFRFDGNIPQPLRHPNEWLLHVPSFPQF